MVKKILQTLGMLVAGLFLASLVLFWSRYDGSGGDDSIGRTSAPRLETPVGPPAKDVDMVLAITDEIDGGGGKDSTDLLRGNVNQFFRQADESSIAFLSSQISKNEIDVILASNVTALQRKQAGGVGKVGTAFGAVKRYYKKHAWRTEGEYCPNYDLDRKGFVFPDIRLPGNLRYSVPERLMKTDKSSGIVAETVKYELPGRTLESTRVFLSVSDEALAGQIEKASMIYFIYDMNYEWRETAFGNYRTEFWPIVRDAFIVKDGAVIWSTFGHVGEKFPPAPAKPPEATPSLVSAPVVPAGPSETDSPEPDPLAIGRKLDTAGLSRPSFDCTRASSAAETMICGNPLLAKLDAALAANYRVMDAADIGKGARDDLRKTQTAWLSDRNRCADTECLAELYRRRIDEVCEYPVLSGIHPICVDANDVK